MLIAVLRVHRYIVAVDGTYPDNRQRILVCLRGGYSESPNIEIPNNCYGDRSETDGYPQMP